MRVREWICASALAVTPALFAQARLTLADAVAEALRANPQVATAAARVAVAEGLRRQAGLGPNPRLFIQSEAIPPDRATPTRRSPIRRRRRQLRLPYPHDRNRR